MSAPMSTAPNPSGGDPTETKQPERPATSPLWLQLAGLGVAGLGALVVAVVGAFFTPYRIGSILVPVSLVIVVGGLTAVTRFAYALTNRVGLSLVPGALWLVMSLVLSAPTTEGDVILLQQNWVAVVYILVGSVTLGVLAYRMIVPRR